MEQEPDPWAGVLRSLLAPPDPAALLARSQVAGRRVSLWDCSDEVEALAAAGRRYRPRKSKDGASDAAA